VEWWELEKIDCPCFCGSCVISECSHDDLPSIAVPVEVSDERH